MADPLPEINDALLALFQSAGKDFLKLTDIRAKLPADLMLQTGINRRSSASQVAEALSPHLGPALALYRKGRTGYIGRPLDAILTGVLRRKPGKSLKGIVAMKLPAAKDAVVAAVNEGLQSGRFRCEFNIHYTPALYLTEAGDPSALASTGAAAMSRPTASVDGVVERLAFKSAYDEIGGGRPFVPLHKIRRRLGWPRARFDALVARLSEEMVIQLQGGDPSTMDEADIRDCYIDQRGRLRIAVTWRDR